jgi:hypothetical protein
MPRLVKRKALWQEIQEVARQLHNYSISGVLHECRKRGVITPRMLASWGNSAGEQRVKAALKHEIEPGVPFSGVIHESEQGEFTWAPVDSMTFEEYCAFLRNGQNNSGRDLKKMVQQQQWGRNKFGPRYDVDGYEEFAPDWYRRFLDQA